MKHYVVAGVLGLVLVGALYFWLGDSKRGYSVTATATSATMNDATPDNQHLGMQRRSPGAVANDNPAASGGDSATATGLPQIHPVAMPAEPAPPVATGQILTRIFYATDRNSLDTPGLPGHFGDDRGEPAYGVATVPLPGQDAAPDAPLLRLESRAGSGDASVSFSTFTERLHLSRIQDEVAVSRDKSLFVFVPGAQASFVQAAQRTARIYHDLHFDGAPVLYSWPAQMRAGKYAADEKSVEWSAQHLQRFLHNAFESSGAERITLIAHSLGARALMAGLKDELAAHPDEATRVRAVILLIPDIDSDEFATALAPPLLALNVPMTLYASSSDLSLTVSADVRRYLRAGESGSGLVLLHGIDTIDASDTHAGLLRQTDSADDFVMRDLYFQIHDGRKADNRFGLDPAMLGPKRYWVLNKRKW